MFGKKQRQLEAKVASLERDLQALLRKDTEEPPIPQIIIHRVDKVVVEHLAYSNNFEAFEIQELSGKLNIGTTYSGPIPKSYLDRFMTKKPPNPVDREVSKSAAPHTMENSSLKPNAPRIRMHAR
jgi:hypothetical protein